MNHILFKKLTQKESKELKAGTGNSRSETVPTPTEYDIDGVSKKPFPARLGC